MYCDRGKNIITKYERLGLPWWLSSEEPACDEGDPGLIPGLGGIPGEGNGNPLQLFLPREFHGQRTLENGAPLQSIGSHRVGHD